MAYCYILLFMFLYIFRHDILEGIGPKEVRLVLQRLVAEKLISLDELNDRLVSFNYGCVELTRTR